MATAPIDMSLMAPRDERLEMLTQDMWECPYADLSGEQKVAIYNVALKEMEVSALSVLAQFLVRAA